MWLLHFAGEDPLVNGAASAAVTTTNNVSRPTCGAVVEPVRSAGVKTWFSRTSAIRSLTGRPAAAIQAEDLPSYATTPSRPRFQVID